MDRPDWSAGRLAMTTPDAAHRVPRPPRWRPCHGPRGGAVRCGEEPTGSTGRPAWDPCPAATARVCISWPSLFDHPARKEGHKGDVLGLATRPARAPAASTREPCRGGILANAPLAAVPWYLQQGTTMVVMATGHPRGMMCEDGRPGGRARGREQRDGGGGRGACKYSAETTSEQLMDQWVTLRRPRAQARHHSGVHQTFLACASRGKGGQRQGSYGSKFVAAGAVGGGRPLKESGGSRAGEAPL